MTDMILRVVCSLLLVLQACPSEVFGWANTQAWSFKNEGDCLRYYANMTFEEGQWCPAMWDGLLCWPPSPYHAVALLPCPRPPRNSERARTAHKRCSPEGKWEDFEVSSSEFSPPSGLRGSRSDPSYQSEPPHSCLVPRDDEFGDTTSTKGAITSYRVSSRIEQRYAQTLVTAKIVNTDTQPSKLQFRMTLPEDAFISSLVMEVDGTNFTSNVKEKSIASRSYRVSKERGKDAALLEQSGMQEFVVSANIVSRHVTFYIKYEELLRRVNGHYMQKIFIRPGMRIPEAEVNIHILEREPIADYRILELPGQELLGNPGAKVSEILLNDGEVQVNYKHVGPPNGYGKGVDGTFTIAYILRNRGSGGKLQRVGSYFNHFISLDANDRMPKLASHTVFALDVSNSMGDGKLALLKSALKTIIKSMTPIDSFEILAFSSDVASLGVFNGTHYRKALRRVKKLQPMSYSNLNAAYLQALKSASEYSGSLSPLAKQVVMITDGHPTLGVLDPMTIRQNILENNTNKIPIFGVGFGYDTPFNLIQQISTDSRAFARHLSNKKTLARDLHTFFKEISRPILTDFSVTYPENEVDPVSVVKMANSVYYSGGEVVAVGRLFPGVRNVHPWVSGESQSGPLHLQTTQMDSVDGPLTDAQMKNSAVIRLWAYLTIKHWLKQAEMSDNYHQVKRLLDQATHLALQFRFVTHVTSLVVRDATGEYETDFLLDDSLHLPLPHGPNEAQASHGPPAFRIERNKILEPQPQALVDMDPHFVVKSPTLDLPLCFDFHANDGATISLIRDPNTGIIVNGQTSSVISRPKLTYMTKLFIAMGKVNITLTPERMEVDCVDDEGNMKVDHVTRSLWPFYKKNGKKYKKRMATYRGRKPQQKNLPSLEAETDHLNVSKVRRLQRLRVDAQEQTTNPPSTENYPLFRRLIMSLMPKQTDEEDIQYVMNSVDDDYIQPRDPRQLASHRAQSRHHHRESNRARQPEVSPRRKSGRRLDLLPNDHGLCNFNSSWKEGAGKKYGDVMVILSTRSNMHIMVGDGLAHFAVVRSRKDGQNFLGFYLEDEEILSPRTHGLVGQFSTKNITSSPPTKTAEGEVMVELSVQRRTTKKRYRVSQVTGYLSQRRSILAQKHVDCIEIRRQGKKLLDGKPRDYILECLQC